MKRIPLTQGKFAVVDDSDYEKLSAIKWYVQKVASDRWYAVNKSHGLLHRFLLDAPKQYEIDHINGDSLDNRRSNLRLCSHAQNQKNKRPYKHNLCGFKGVIREYRRFRARITVDGKRIQLGSYDTSVDAARAYDQAAIKYFGQFARLNFS